MTTTRQCLCDSFNAQMCAVRAKRGLCCLKLAKPSGPSPYMTFAEAERAALETGGRVRAISTLGHYGSPRKFYVEAAR
jgi:hypothetical protein